MPRDDKLRFYIEPPLSHVLGKQAWLAGALVFLGGAMAWRFADWRWGIVVGVLGAAVAVRLFWRRYQFEARHPTEGEFDAEGLPHGRWLWRFPSGVLGRDVEYRHGQFHGSDFWFFPDGTNFQEARFEGGELYGPLKEWRRNGELEYEVEVRAGLAHGRCTCHLPDGTGFEASFDDGEQHGPFRRWHANGQLAEEMTFDHGKPDGAISSWHENGALRSTGVLVAGERHGLWTSWHANGERWIRGEYKWGAGHGRFTEWAEDGTERQASEYAAGYELGSSSRPFEPVEPGQRPSRTRWLFRGLVLLLLLAVVRDAYLLVPLLLLAVTIGVHELGHLLAAKLVGIPLRQFRVGLGPVWFRRLHRGTVYEWSTLPVLGYVAEYAMRASEWNHARAVLRARRKEQPDPEYPAIDPSELRRAGSKLVGPARRLVYLLAGVTFNLLTAWLAIWAFHAGEPSEPHAPGSFTQACRSMAATSEGIFEAILTDAQVLVQMETYTSYRPSLLAALSDETRAMFLPPDDLAALAAGDDIPSDHLRNGADETSSSRDGDQASPAAKAERWAELLGPDGRARGLLILLFAVHFAIGAFNLLPIAPLDGYHCVATVLEAVLGRGARFILRPLSFAGMALLLCLALANSFLLLRDLVVAVFR